MMINKLPLLNYWLKRSDTAGLIQPTKFLSKRIRLNEYKILITRIINSPMSLPPYTKTTHKGCFLLRIFGILNKKSIIHN